MSNNNNRRPGPGGGHGPGAMHMPFEKAKDAKGTLKRLVEYLKPRKTKIFFIFLMAILSTIFAIVSPKIMGKATTKLFNGFIAKMKGIPGAAIDFEGISKIVLILIGLYAFSAAFNFFQQFIMAEVAQRTVYDMRKNIYKKLTKLPLKFFDSRTHGEILSRVTNDVDNISSTLQQSLTQLITSIVTLIGVIIMMLTISPLLTLICIVVLPLSAILIKTITKYSQKYFKQQQKILGNLNGHVEEMYSGHKIIKAFGHEEKSINKFNEVNDNLYGSSWKAQFISGIIHPLMNFINNISYVIVCVIGGVFAVKKMIEIGDVQAFIQYSRQFAQPLAQTASIANTLQSTIASAERVFEILDEVEEIADKPSINTTNQKTTALPVGNVSFEHVKFGYNKDVPIIHDMSINVKKGQVVAIVGPTGAGKTTIVNLLMRFYDIDKGKITIENVDIKDLSRKDLRNTFGMVLQDTWLFNGTIHDNIAYGNENASDEEIITAAKAAHADHFIRTLPDGYDTILNEESSNISQGQKQLLTIARAILADPAVLILDEATSSVDTRTEIYIQNAMIELMKGRTSFVIAHRLSTIRDADIILVMKNGKIIEKGNHQELMLMNGFYTDLYNSQFTGKAI